MKKAKLHTTTTEIIMDVVVIAYFVTSIKSILLISKEFRKLEKNYICKKSYQTKNSYKYGTKNAKNSKKMSADSF